VLNPLWSSVVTYSDPISAEAVLPILRDGEVPCRIRSDETLPGLASFFSVEVPSELLHRARWLLDSAKVSDSELTYLATKELSDGSEGR
jgi:hypothetical protein